MPLDWLKSSNQQRISLHDAVTRLVKLRQIMWSDIYALMRLDPKKDQTSFHENFRKGKISRARAALIYKYLADNHPHEVAALDAAVSTTSVFWQFLIDYRRLGALEIQPETISIPFRSNRLGPEWREFPFEAGDPICFRLRLPQIYRCACALNGGLEGWYPIVLQEPRDYEFLSEAPPGPVVPSEKRLVRNHPFIKPVTQGAQTICSAPPTEAEHARRLRDNNIFVFIAGDGWLLEEIARSWRPDTRVANSELDRLATTLLTHRDDGWTIAQLNAHGMGRYPDEKS